MALHEATRGSDAGFTLFDSWSAQAEGQATPSGNPAYCGKVECRAKWDSFSTEHGNPVSRGTLFKMALEHGFIAPGVQRRDPIEPTPPQATWPQPEWVWRQDEPPSFPIDSAFPPALDGIREVFRKLAWCYQVPIDLVVLLAMPIAMATLAGKVVIKVRGERWTEPAVLWMLAAMRSGGLKSPIHRELIRPVRNWEKALDPTPALAHHKAKLVAADTRHKSVVTRLRKLTSESDPVPPPVSWTPS